MVRAHATEGVVIVGDKVMATRVEDVPRIWIHEGLEYSHRLVTRKRQGCTFSFHITTYEPNFDTIVEGDGIHEVVLYCLEGESRQIVEGGPSIHFTPGTATYLPVRYRYRHIVGPKGLKIAVCANPAKE
jgi:L-ectoine synthase